MREDNSECKVAMIELGLFPRCLPLCAYCSMGFFLELPEVFLAFAFAIDSRSRFQAFRCLSKRFRRSYTTRRRASSILRVFSISLARS